MPTETQWEYACRAGAQTPFAFGKCLSTGQTNYNGNYPMPGCSKGKSLRKTITAASLRPNKWGLYDMHGNVWEWCQDWYGDYQSELKQIRRGRSRARPGCSVADPGATMPGNAGRRTAPGSSLKSGTEASGFVLSCSRVSEPSR